MMSFNAEITQQFSLPKNNRTKTISHLMITWLCSLNFAVFYKTCVCTHTQVRRADKWLSPTGLIHKNMLKPTKKAIAHICKPLGLITKCSTGIIAETKPYVGHCSTLICSQGLKTTCRAYCCSHHNENNHQRQRKISSH